MKKLSSLWVDDLNQRNIPLTQAAVTNKDTELSPQTEEKKEIVEGSALKYIETSDLQHIFSDMEILTDEFCEPDRNWERTATMKSSVTVSIDSYFESLKKKKKKERRNVYCQHCVLS